MIKKNSSPGPRYPGGEADLKERWAGNTVQELELELVRLNKASKTVSQLYDDFGIYELEDSSAVFESLIRDMKETLRMRKFEDQLREP